MTKEEIAIVLDELNQWMIDFNYIIDTGGYKHIQRFWMTKLKFMEYKYPALIARPWGRFDDATLSKVQQYIEGEIGYNSLEDEGFSLGRFGKGKYLLPICSDWLATIFVNHVSHKVKE